jgi:hypothetical protein
MNSQINDSQTTISFTSTSMFPGHQITTFLVDIPTMPQHMLPVLINPIQQFKRQLQRTHVKGWQG